MGKTLITCGDKDFEHDGDQNINDKGLTIGGYESAWLADLVTAFVLENTAQFFDEAAHDGTHRENGLVDFEGNWFKLQITNWLTDVQEEVDKVTK
jgi:hypothetical protein